MSSMVTRPFTSFPDLSSSTRASQAPSPATAISVYAGIHVPRRLVIRAWARLLAAYTGDDEVVFLIDETPHLVCVSQDDAVETLDSSISRHGTPTAILLDHAASSPDASILLRHSQGSGDAALHLKAPLPQSHLGELTAQLRLFLFQLCHQEHLPLPFGCPRPLLSVSNSNPTSYRPALLHSLIEQHASSELPAIMHLDQHDDQSTISHNQLASLSSNLAFALANLDCFRTKDPSQQLIVPVLLPQCPDLYVALLAILKAGAAFCPLNLDSPQERIRFVMADTAASVIVTTSEFKACIPAELADRAFLLDTVDDHTQRPASPHLPQQTPSSFCYVMYTSGSTGRPKGVSLSHSAVTQSLLAHDVHMPQFSRFLQFAAPTFDVSMFEIFFTLFRGSAIVSCDRQVLLNDLPGVMNRLQVDAAELTPTVAGSLLRTRSSTPSLKLLLTIGEMLSLNVIREFGESPENSGILYAMYGPTEAAIHCTLQPRIAADSKVGHIGRPLATVSALVLPFDPRELQPLPVGQVGELALGGYQLANGYLNRDEQTAASFIDHPDYGKLYRTGDRVRLLPDGTLDFVGRVSAGQVKLRGQRIELGEVEAVASRSTGVANSAASVIDDQMILFFQPGSPQPDDETSIVNRCRSWLPGFMVPSEVVLVSQWPQLPSGKVDKKQLEKQYTSRLSEENTAQAADSSASQHDVISQAVSNVLNRSVARDTDLSKAGLDSLKAIRLAAALRQAGSALGAADVLRANSINSISDIISEDAPQSAKEAAWFEGARETASKQALQDPNLSKRASDIAEIFPCSPLQSSMLAETTLNKDAYWNSIELEFDIRSADEVESVIQQVVNHHEMLRSGFLPTSDSKAPYVQVVWRKLEPWQIQRDTLDGQDKKTTSVDELLHPLRVGIQPRGSGWRVTFRLHHAQYDGWSWDLVLSDFTAVMQGRTLARRPSFQNVSKYSNQFVQSDQAQESRSYWKASLQNYSVPTFPILSGDRVPRLGTKKLSRSLTIPKDKVYSLSDALEVHPQTIFQGALALLLGQYLGVDDLVLGTVLSGRTISLAGIEDVVGPCIATLPLRTSIDSELRVADFLRNLHLSGRKLLQHSLLPLSAIKHAAGFSPGATFFDVLAIWQETLQGPEDFDPRISQVSSLDYVENKIILEIDPSGESLVISATFWHGWIPESHMGLFLEQLDGLIAKVVFASDGRSDKLSDVRCEAALSTFNEYPTYVASGQALSEPIESIAEQDPDRLAVIVAKELSESSFETLELTYKDLNRRANQVAHALANNKVKEDELVCVLADKSIELYVAMLGIIKAGAAYVGVSPDAPRERTKIVFAQANSRLCLCSKEALTACPDALGFQGTILEIDGLDNTDYSSSNPSLPFNGNRLAYAIFTSGTTGVPKGVLVTQQNLSGNIEALVKAYPLPKRGSRMLQACPHTFDVSMFEIFWSWRQGMCICTTPRDLLFRDIERAIRAFQTTHLSMTATVASLVRPDNVPCVEFIVTAGEPLTETVRRNWAGRGLINAYGPSETTNICTANLTMTQEDSLSLVGAPLENTSAFVLSPNSDGFKPLPRGAIGEFCFGGEQVFRSYLNNDQLNSEKLLSHPQFGKIYRSGDLGRMLHNGTLLISGRIDDQVKIRGQRVELAEIDNVVHEISGVHSCLTLLVKEDGAPSQSLVSFWRDARNPADEFEILALDDELLSTVHRIFDAVADRLPSYMCPDALVPVSRLPNTSQTKIDKARLRKAYSGLSEVYLSQVSSGFDRDVGDDDAEWSSVETEVAEALSQSAGIPKSELSRRASLFTYGIDSVTAISLSRALRAGLSQPRVEVSTIMRNMTIGQLAKAIEGLAASSKPLTTEVLKSAFSDDDRSQMRERFSNAEKILPCTPLQEALLSADPGSNANGNYNITVFQVKVEGAKMKAAWESMVQRHEILRTCFTQSSSREHPFAQVVLESTSLDWQELSIDHDDATLAAQDARVVPSPVLDSGKPPFKLVMWTSGQDNRQMLGLFMHHVLYDGVALTVLMTEIEKFLNGKELPKSVSFEPFLERALTLDAEEADRFWHRQLENFAPNPFPDLTGVSPSKRADLVGHHISHFDFELPLSLIQSRCRENRISMLSACQAAWAKVLSVYLSETDICFGNVVSGRSLPAPDIERLVAPCFNTLPVRIAIDPQGSNQDLAQCLQSINSDSLSHQMTPLRRLQAQAGQRLFDTLFILQQNADPLDGSIWEFKADFGEMDFPVVCEILPVTSNDTLTVSLHTRRSLILDHDTPVLFSTLDHALRSCIMSPNDGVFDFSKLHSESLAVSNASPQPFHTDKPLLHSAFEHNVSRNPDLPALDFMNDDGTHTLWTFKQLNTEADRIANSLMDRGVDREEAVPIHIPKSPLFYASILGVLKAGAVFTPFDPATPQERKKFMLEELGVRQILSHSTIDNAWCDRPVLNVDKLPSALNQSSVTTKTPRISYPSSLAYRLYTSGSTGKPKAVSVEHRNASQTILASRSLIRWTASTRLLQFAAVTFDMCYYDCFLAWSFGFCLCAASQETMFNDLAQSINALKISMLDLTPSVAKSLKKASVPSVEFLYCIGEAMPQSLVDSWSGQCVNSYGPTEAAMCVTIQPMHTEIKSTVIGEPFGNTSFHTMSKSSGLLVPIFGIGELFLGGSQIAREYHANPSLTNEQFVEHSGCRLYKTGDLVRKLGNGTYEFIGRADDQVKVRGLRVELGEISAAIRDCDSRVQDVSTQVMSTSSTAKDQIVAFVVSSAMSDHGNKEGAKDTINQSLAQKLPSYMIPTVILFIDSIPLSPAGKADKKALLDVFRKSGEASDVSSDDQDREALNAKEKSVRETLSNLSSVSQDTITRRSTIFQLGFDSISAVQIASELKRKGFSISAAKIMSSPTLEGIAAVSQESSNHHDAQPGTSQPIFDFAAFDRQNRPSICKKLALSELSIARIRPCSPLQSGMLIKFINSQGKEYFNRSTYKLSDSIDTGRLEEAWDFVIERHEMLRTGFTSTDNKGSPMAMLTFRARCAPNPVTVTRDGPLPSDWHSQCRAAALDALHEPPWRVLIHAGTEESLMSISMHHALFDAHSMEIMLSDLAGAYNGKVHLDATPPVESILAKTIASPESFGDEAKRFWKDAGGKAMINQFPDLTPLHVSDLDFGTAVRESRQELSTLQRACQSQGVTMQAAGQAAWARVLAAYIGEDLVTFGCVFSGRLDEDAESTAFPSIATMPIIADGTNSDDQLMHYLLEYNARIHAYQNIPLAQVQRWMGLGQTSPFSTLFAYQKHDSLDDSRPWTLIDEHATVEYPLSIEIQPGSTDSLKYRLTYRKDIIPEEQAEKLLDQVDSALCTLLIPNSEPTDSQQFGPDLYSVSDPKHDTLPSAATLLHEFVEHSAAEYPSKIAFEFFQSFGPEGEEKKTWTYPELDWEGNRVANFLLQNKVSQGSIVAICFDKCPEASFAMLGILKAGCAFLAVDSGAPAERKKFIVEDSKAAAILTMQKQSNDFPDALGCPVYAMDLEQIRNSSADKPALGRAIQPSDTSYCLYTSGTTGKPKGCELTHENAVQALLAFQHLFKWELDSRFLQFASYHFDVSVMEQYWSWSVGICMVSAPRDVILEDLAGTIKSLNITHLDLTPSLARLLEPSEVPSLCKSTSVFITGGEQLKQEIIGQWGSHGTIYNGYGPTEATIGCTMFPRVPETGKPSNIGPPFLNVGTFVLRPGTDRPVLRGAQGELCVFGPLVAKGYLNRPDLTAERFPTICINGEKRRVYRTGDLVRLLHDGTFAFLGRADDQVKLRGQRLEIGEINAVEKASSDDIQENTTLVIKHPKQQKEQLVSFLAIEHHPNRKQQPEILSNGSAPAISAAREACQKNLPGYMVPTHFVPMNYLPLSANNKVDAKQLKALYESLESDMLQKFSDLDQPSDEQWTETDRSVARVLAEYLDVEASTINKSSSVFELGVDSISAIGFAKALKDAGLGSVSTSSIMKNSTVTALAKTIESSSRGTSTLDDPSTKSARQMIAAFEHRYKPVVAQTLGMLQSDIESVAPCTPLQQGIIARSLESDRPVYFAQFNFELLQDTNIEKLRGACDRLLKRIPLLRTMFCATSDGHAQVALKEMNLSWTEIELDRSSDSLEALDRAHGEWWSRNREHIREPLNVAVASSPVARVMALNIFHALYDGTSLPLLMQDVLEEYYSPDSADVGPSFHDALPYGPLRQPEGAKKFWEGHFERATPSVFQPFQPLIRESSGEDSIATMTIDDIPAFEECRRRLNTTHQALVQACWIATLQEAFDRPIPVGMVVSGRSIDFPDAHRVIGPLFNTIPFVLRLNKGMSWASAIDECHSFNTAALAFQHTPLRDIKKWSQDRVANNELFQTLFVFQKHAPVSPDTREPIWKTTEDSFEADYPLAFEAEHDSEGRLTLTVVSQAHISDENRSIKLLTRFQELLSTLLADPQASIGDKVQLQTMDDDVSHTVTSNGHTTGPTNGSKKAIDFAWDAVSQQIRDDVAELADTPASDIDAHTSILELGLDSIDAIKLSSRLRRSLNIQIPVSKIMRALTIAGISQSVSANGSASNAQELHSAVDLNYEATHLQSSLEKLGFDMDGLERILPVTPLQEAMMSQMLASNFEEYFNHDIVRIEPGIDVDKLKSAWQSVVNANAILRTSFVELEDPALGASFAQAVHKPAPLDWQVLEESHDQKDLIMDRIRAEVAQGSKREIPLRLSLLQNPGESPTHLIISVSHALYDGWSLSLVHDDVAQAYHEEVKDRPLYDAILSDILETSRSSSAQDFWSDALSGLQPTLLPCLESNSGAALSVYRQQHSSALDMSKVQSFCRAHGVTVNALCQTAYSMLLSSLTRKLDVAFGVVISGRDSEEANEVIFPTMNTVAFRSVVHGSRKEMVKYVQDTMNSMKPFEKYPLRKALSLVQKSRQEAQYGEVFDSLFIFQRSPESDEASEKRKLYESIAGASDVEFPLATEAEVVDGKLVWRNACKAEAFTESTALKVLEDVDGIVSRIIEEPESPAAVFEQDAVSVCGLASFSESQSTEAVTSGGTETGAGADSLQGSTHLQQTIRRVLAQVAQIPEGEVSVSATMFNLGLDSISAIKVSSLLRKQGIRLTVGEMLKAGSVTRIAQVAHERTEDPNGPSNSSIDASGTIEKALADVEIDPLLESQGIEQDQVERIMPATAGQIYMLCRYQRHGLFFPTFEYYLSGFVTFEQLRKAWATLVAKEPLLRTVLISTASSKVPFVQVTKKSVGSSDEISDQEEGSLGLENPFMSLSAHLSDEGWLLSFHIHHALYDGVSLSLLMSRLQALCNEDRSSRVDTPPEHSPFADFVASGLATTSLDDQASFWKGYLADLPLQPQGQLSASTARRVELFEPALLQTPALTRTAAAHTTSIQALILAVYARLHARRTRAADALVGVYLANRASSDAALHGLEHLAAPTVALVPLRVRQADSRTATAVASDVAADLRAVQEGARAGVGLWQLGEHARVTTWVNFLHLPGDSDDDDDSAERGDHHGRGKQDAGVKIIEPSKEEGFARVVDTGESDRDAAVMPLVEGNAVAQAYEASVDLEVAVRDDKLAVGLFCPEDMMGLAQARELVDELRAELIALCE